VSFCWTESIFEEYDLESVRKTVGVIFQDFIRYTFRIDENIGVGEIEKVRDYLDLTEVARKKTVRPSEKNSSTPQADKTGSAGYCNRGRKITRIDLDPKI